MGNEIERIEQAEANAGAGTEVESRHTLSEYTSRQQRIFDNKVDHGFNVTNPYREVGYLVGEVSELLSGIIKGDKENILEELSDIVIYAYGLASVTKAGDLDDAIFEKMKINENRVYIKDGHGEFKKAE